MKNVFFIGGTACAGKTTISKLIAEKYDYYLYDQDKQNNYHHSIANPENQPAMCYPHRNREEFEKYFLRPADEFVKTFNCAEECFENIFLSLEYGNRVARQNIEQSGFYTINRSKSSTIEKTMRLVEQHFGLNK